MKSWGHEVFQIWIRSSALDIKPEATVPGPLPPEPINPTGFADRHRVGLSSLSKWLRVESETPSPRLKFQEVTLPNMPLRYAVEVVSPQGWTVRLHNSSDVQQLPALLQALPC
jgi:hypothetical protein